MTDSAQTDALRPRMVVWGSELSPFTLKLHAMLAYAGVSARLLPTEGGAFENLGAMLRVNRIKSGRLALTCPRMSELDEFPLVPYLLGGGGENLYDSTAIAGWLDRGFGTAGRSLLPVEPVERFVAAMIDEYFDEFGLYMVHHNRWVISARDNDAGARLAHEFRSMVLPPLRRLFAAQFSSRQVRRLPYLFSVAPPGYDATGLSRRRRPPVREGFPPTHELLDRAFARMLERVEHVLADQEFLLGNRFTLADASAYGQLAMNLKDPSASDLIATRAPLTYAWLERIADGRAWQVSRDGADVEVSSRLSALLEEIAATFVPLMRQNEAAYERHRAAGERTFNEAAFDAGRALYDGELCGVPFRSVAKTFQVAVWRRLRDAWDGLEPAARSALPFAM